MRVQAADYDEDTVMEYTPPEETNRRQRQREIEAERDREQKVQLCCPIAHPTALKNMRGLPCMTTSFHCCLSLL